MKLRPRLDSGFNYICDIKPCEVITSLLTGPYWVCYSNFQQCTGGLVTDSFSHTMFCSERCGFKQEGCCSLPCTPSCAQANSSWAEALCLPSEHLCVFCWGHFLARKKGRKPKAQGESKDPKKITEVIRKWRQEVNFSHKLRSVFAATYTNTNNSSMRGKRTQSL